MAATPQTTHVASQNLESVDHAGAMVNAEITTHQWALTVHRRSLTFSSLEKLSENP
jgi:hypothetical protein